MSPVALVAAFILSAAAPPAPPNPCTNGSFEELRPDGFPADWERVGQTVQIVHDAHSGQNALRLLRTPDTKESETGLNRTWKAHGGEQGKMIARLKGGIVFWYKAISAAEGTKLTVQAIPMNAEPIEQTDSLRALFAVPKEHIGDGQWHEGRLKYDFTADPKAKWVHFAARILGSAGELLLDDLSYVDQVGPLIRFARVRLDEDQTKPGESCTISAVIENAGDAKAPDVRATLTTPPELRAVPAELRLGDLAPGSTGQAAWTLLGRRTRSLALALRAAAGAAEATASIALAPELVLESFGPATPVGTVGVPLAVEGVMANPGNAIATDLRAELTVLGVWDREPEGPTEVIGLECLRPGESRVFRFNTLPRRDSTNPAAALTCRVVLSAANVPRQSIEEAALVAVPHSPVPGPCGRLRAVSTETYALIENERVRLLFRHTAAGFGPGEFQARTAAGWRTVAWMPSLGRVLYRGLEGSGKMESSCMDLGFAGRPQAETGKTAQLSFSARLREANGTTATLRRFSLGPGERCITASYEFTRDAACELEAFPGPRLYALERDEGIFPGLEWLVPGEMSSSALDIDENHLDCHRELPPPNAVTVPAIGLHQANGTVGLLWDVHQRWGDARDRPSAVFDSPDRISHQRSHLMHLLVPTAADPRERTRNGPPPSFSLSPNEPVRVRCRIFVDGEAKDALAAVDEWIRIYGLPEPAPLPRRHDPSDPSDRSDRSDPPYESEIQFSMQAYLKSLWLPETKEWWTTKGGGRLMSKKGRPPAFVADLLLGAMVAPDEAVRKQCRERAEEVAKLLKIEPRLDAMRFPGRFDLAVADPSHAARFLATMGEDGAWRFDANKEDQDVFKGRDYHELGPDGAVEVGTCARNAYEILRYARIAGDEEAYRRMGKTLRLMETFRVPRAAQVWEVPVHSPDLLAAADAADAYIEAYRYSGDERWLADAVTWARRGIPFIYLWNPADKPWLLGASIPVYGASWFTCSWFGRPVQWNGLRYATAILKLAEYDHSKDWRRLAELIIRSAILQQDPDGQNVALWPDNISAIDGKKCPWVFSPRQIIQNILLLNGRDEEPRTTILWAGRPRPARRLLPFLFGPERRIHVTATAKITDAAWDGASLSFKAGYPPGEEGVVLVSNVAKPKAVLLDGKPLAERSEVEKSPEPGWRYDEGLAYLSIRVCLGGGKAVSGPPHSKAGETARGVSGADRVGPRPAAKPRDALECGGSTPLFPLRGTTAVGQGRAAGSPALVSAIRIEGARYRRVGRLPRPADRIDFAFRRSTEGWMAAHDIADLGVRNGALCGRITGGDPYLVRSLLRVRGDDCPALLIRLRLTAGHTGQFYWMTEASPAFAEDKTLRFDVQADGAWHDYRLEPGRHALWAGQRITGIRIDPGNGAGAAEFGLEFLRGEGR